MGLPYTSRSYLNFCRGISEDVTREDYDHGLKAFIDYAKVSDPDELLLGETEKLEDRVMDFISFQKGRGKSFSLISQQTSAIALFYNMNRKALLWKLIRKTIGKKTVKKDRGYRHEEIAKLLQFAKPRETVSMLLMASAGIRIGGLPGLLVRHLQKITLENDVYIYKIVVYEGAEEEYVTFCTPECAAAIDRYFDYRRVYGETIKEDAPLLRMEFNKRSKCEVNNPLPIDEETVRNAITDVALASGIRVRVKVDPKARGSVRHTVKITHGFKKFASTNMIRADIKPTYREYMLSHKKGRKELGVSELQMIYDRPEHSDLLKDYVRAIDVLTVDPKFTLQKEMNILREQIRDIPKVEELQSRLAEEIMDKNALKKRIDKMADEFDKKLDERDRRMMDRLMKNPKLLEESYKAKLAEKR